jgi:hypothetical protein
MTDLIKITSVIYLILSFFLSIVIFSKGEMNILLLVIIPAVIIFHGFMILLLSFALCKIIEELKSSHTITHTENFGINREASY